MLISICRDERSHDGIVVPLPRLEIRMNLRAHSAKTHRSKAPTAEPKRSGPSASHQRTADARTDSGPDACACTHGSKHELSSIPVQRRAATGAGGRSGAGRASRRSANGLPERLQSGIESLSGIAMDDVTVHYNSPKPSQVAAHAYTQGTQIHIARGQEQHLPHEAWHVVQQKQRRVRPTMKVNGKGVNDDTALEREADRMGARAASGGAVESAGRAPSSVRTSERTIQRARTKGNGTGVGTKKRKVIPPKNQTQVSNSNVPTQSTPIVQSTQTPPQSGQTSSQNTQSSTQSTESFQDFLDTKGAKQQGQISTVHGKHFAGPVSMKKRRAPQVKRHITNLVLNRLTYDQNEEAKKKAPTTASKIKAVNAKTAPKQSSNGVQKPKKAKKPKGDLPVEIQMSSVGKRLLLNSNNPKASRALYEMLQKEGGLKKYISGANALKPAMDKDLERPKRQKTKIDEGLNDDRPWQKDSTGEDDVDIKQANSILAALKNETSVGMFDPDDEEGIEKEIEKWKDDTAPLVYVPLHSSNDLKNEHAERIQTKIRKKYLSDFEDDLSTPPSGPKTTCLGCDSNLTANYPELAPKDEYNGAYFEKSSPATTEKEKAVALDRVKKRPATGSISQEGYLRNSDWPDSDSDEEGNEVFPRPLSFTVGFNDKPPTKTKWKTGANKEEEFPAKMKRKEILKKMSGTPKKSSKSQSSNAKTKVSSTQQTSTTPKRKRSTSSNQTDPNKKKKL